MVRWFRGVLSLSVALLGGCSLLLRGQKTGRAGAASTTTESPTTRAGSTTGRRRAAVGTGFSSVSVSQGRLYTLGNQDDHMGWRDGWTFYPLNSRELIVHEKAQLQEPDGHNLRLLWADFLDSIAKGRQPVADIELAHRSTCLCLLGMLSLKAGRSIQWDGTKEQMVGDAEANQLLSRKYCGPWEYPKT